MNSSNSEPIENQDWLFGPAKELMGLREHETAYIELKLTLGKNLKMRRRQRNLTQVELASLLGSNQSRIAKMEAGDPSVSIDLLVKSLLFLDATKKDLAAIISQGLGHQA